MNKEEAINTIKILQSLIEIGDASIILNTFVAAFNDKQIIDSNGQVFLQGNFNLNGTKSGRLSSSKPNLTNIPSTGSKYAKLIKACFTFCSNKEWIICGADFDALEAKISALITKDPNKVKIYTDGYDSHSLNAYGYWPDKFKGIKQVDPNDNINTYLVDIDGQEYYLTDIDEIKTIDNKIITVKEYYENSINTNKEI